MCNDLLPSDKFYRSFVLVPHEICVVPYRHGKIFPERNDMAIAMPPSASLRSAPYRWKAVLKSLSLGRGAELVEAERGYAENNAIRKHNDCKQIIFV